MATTAEDSPKERTKDDAFFVDYCSLSADKMRSLVSMSPDDRLKEKDVFVPVSAATRAQVQTLPTMSFLEEASIMAFLAMGVPNGIFTIPIVVFLIGRFVVGDLLWTFTMFGGLLLPLILLPQPFFPSSLHSWIAIQTVRYFSFRFIVEELPPAQPLQHPRILVAPPHGVFPYGNILSMIIHPSLVGYAFRGLAASSALRVPVFKQILRCIGIIDASRHVAQRALEKDPSRTIGISTGGVAEVFETNGDDECIVLKERKGLIKLAIRTGADLVPCYLFGNTKVLSCWAGGGLISRDQLERISRKLGFALIIIFGRLGLPIPYRVPVLGVMGKGIPTAHIQCAEPTNEQVEEIQAKLLTEMEALFERYKGLYGWPDKKLIIK